MRTVAVIPARYQSSRFPGKPLALLHGKPIIQHVYESVCRTALFTDVLVATDDERIFRTCLSLHMKVVMTSADHQSGSDRVAEVIRDMNIDIVVNVQGDEPFIQAEPLRHILAAFEKTNADVVSLMHPMQEEEEINNDLYREYTMQDFLD